MCYVSHADRVVRSVTGGTQGSSLGPILIVYSYTTMCHNAQACVMGGEGETCVGGRGVGGRGHLK